MNYDDLVVRLAGHGPPPSVFEFVGDKIENLFDPGNRHKSGKKPYDYLVSWLSMLRPFAYATKDESWGELEKLLCIVMRNYVQMQRLCPQAADAIERLQAELVEVRDHNVRLMKTIARAGIKDDRP